MNLFLLADGMVLEKRLHMLETTQRSYLADSFYVDNIEQAFRIRVTEDSSFHVRRF
jgi:hypothetical protein